MNNAAKELGKVAVLFGGSSAERPVSLKSGAMVLAALQAQGVDAHPFDPQDQELAELRGYDRAFIALHGGAGENGTLQGALELMSIPYTGSGVLASALAMDKWRTKLLWQAAGIPVPEFVLLDKDTDFAAVERQLGLPIFVKPANEGSSIGISKVREHGGLRAAYEEAARYDDVVIAERFIDAGEYTVAVVGDQVMPMIKIEPANDFYDYDAKYLRDDTRYLIPCGLPEAQEQSLRELALRAFRVLGCRGWGRVDLMLDKAGKPYFLEINTAPGMTDHSLVPMSARAAGVDYPSLCMRVLQLARWG